MSYNIKTDYIQGEPPSSSDLNRRGLVLEAQVPGSLAVFGEGVISGFAVTLASGSYSATAGAAIITADTDSTPVFARSEFALPVAGIVPGEINYVHLALQTPTLPGQPETLLGDAPAMVVSADEGLPDSLLLAEISAAGEVTDRRIFIALNSLSARVAQLEADVGYTDEDRAIGTVAHRLGNINAGLYDDTDLRNQIAGLAAQIAALSGAGEGSDVDEVENESSIVASTLMRLESFTVSIHPDYANATTTSLDQPRYAGYGQLLDGGEVSPNIDGGGNAVVDFQDNSVHG